MNARIDTHEKVCAERYTGINSQLKRLESWFVAMVGSTMALMATIIIRGLP